MFKKCVEYHAKDYNHVVMVWQISAKICSDTCICLQHYLFQDANSHEKAQETLWALWNNISPKMNIQAYFYIQMVATILQIYLATRRIWKLGNINHIFSSFSGRRIFSQMNCLDQLLHANENTWWITRSCLYVFTRSTVNILQYPKHLHHQPEFDKEKQTCVSGTSVCYIVTAESISACFRFW